MVCALAKKQRQKVFSEWIRVTLVCYSQNKSDLFLVAQTYY